MRYHVKNRTGSVRKFQAGGRYLTLAGGESERNVGLGKDEADALRATNEFYVTEVPSMGKIAAPAASNNSEPAKPAKSV